jgi:hypothetical protein
VETRLECPELGMECIPPLVLLESLLQKATVFELTRDKYTKYPSIYFTTHPVPEETSSEGIL